MVVQGDSFNSAKIQKKRPVWKILLFVFVAIIGVIILLCIAGSIYIKNELGPVDPGNKKPVTVEIPIGSSTQDIGHLLKEKNLIESSTLFRYYILYKEESGFKAGVYELNRSMDADQIIAALKDGKHLKKQRKVTIPEGFTVPQTAEAISKATGKNKNDILKIMNDETFLKDLKAKYPVLGKEIFNKKLYYPLEGYLFPATYEIDTKGADPKKIIEKMVKKTNDVVNEYGADFEQSKKSTFTILTLASLIEEESQRPEDRTKISGVFYNRLAKGMKLESDPTVKYAMKKFNVKVYYKDLKINSPYNTYKYKGLPVGPIASPGEESIKAALHPTKSDYLFFYARPNGEVIYTKTLKEHDEVYKKYHHEWDKIARKS